MAHSATFSIGDRLSLRDRAWRVLHARSAPQSTTILELLALDDEEPGRITVSIPPDEAVQLPPSTLAFDTRALEAWRPWLHAHQAIAATATPGTGVHSGRIALVGYQLMPVFRALGKPRPRLLIADDVGLGKTIEAGLVLAELMARGRVRRTLIVAPPGLLLQWRGEPSKSSDSISR